MANVNDTNMYEGLNLSKIPQLNLHTMLYVNGSELKAVFTQATNWSVSEPAQNKIKTMFWQQNSHVRMSEDQSIKNLEMAIYANALLAVICHDHHVSDTASDVETIPCEYVIVMHEHDFITVFNFRTRAGVVANKQEYTDLLETSDAIRHGVKNDIGFEHMITYIPQAKVVDNA